tara:strand:- start:320 stop:556 length:237 start_codon:yes stop_codon:yes gene_type:complete
MNIFQKTLIVISIIVLTTSCDGWTEKDKERYLTECERAKLDSVFCNCSLNKITLKYGSFEDAMRNEIDFPEIFTSCKE